MIRISCKSCGGNDFKHSGVNMKCRFCHTTFMVHPTPVVDSPTIIAYPVSSSSRVWPSTSASRVVSFTSASKGITI